MARPTWNIPYGPTCISIPGTARPFIDRNFSYTPSTLNLELVHRVYQIAGSSWSWSEEHLKEFVLCCAELTSIWERLHEFETISDCIKDMAASQIYPLGPDIPSVCNVSPPNEWKLQACLSLPAILTPQQEWHLLLGVKAFQRPVSSGAICLLTGRSTMDGGCFRMTCL